MPLRNLKLTDEAVWAEAYQRLPDQSVVSIRRSSPPATLASYHGLSLAKAAGCDKHPPRHRSLNYASVNYRPPTVCGWLSGWWLLILLLPMVVGCRGCDDGRSQSTAEDDEQQRRGDQQAELLANDLVSLPADAQRSIVTVKRGHWLETTQRFKALQEDKQVLSVGTVVSDNQPLTVPATNFVNQFSRRTSLPKGQEKALDLQFFVPTGMSASESIDGLPPDLSRLTLQTELLAVPLMVPLPTSGKRTAVAELKENEFHMVVLSPQALGYQYLASLDAVYWTGPPSMLTNDRTRSYEVTLVQPRNNQYLLPSSLLTMTSIAAIVWDDVAPQDLSADQQTALLDWLHWGGQLIICGPTSWSRLQNSFLSPYLPATSAASSEVDSASLAALAATWQTVDLSANPVPAEFQIVGQPIAGLQFQLNDAAQWLPGSGETVAERRIGRGRIALTGFPLRESRIYSWPYFSSFLSSGLLRRWPRQMARDQVNQELTQTWAAPYQQRNLDPRLHSNLRILARDLARVDSRRFRDYRGGPAPVGHSEDKLPPGRNRRSSGDSAESATSAPVVAAAVAGALDQLTQSISGRSHAHEAGQWGGAGAWSDYSGVSAAAVESLRAAAGIELPSRATILKLLGGYLLCLVPLNYLLFRMIGRLELAWVAAPLMAVAAVVVVGKVAQLDIGFARRTIDVGLLELYHDHPRGHLSQYLALYTSLSTNYSVTAAGHDAATLPMGDVTRAARRSLGATRQLRTQYGHSDGVVLEPLTVYSNSLEMLHAEQMIRLDSPVRYVDDGQSQLVLNTTNFPISGAVVIGRTSSGAAQTAWLGNLAAGQRRELRWETTAFELGIPGWNQQFLTRSVQPTATEMQQSSELWIGGILHQVLRNAPLPLGKIMLIGYTSQRLGDLTIKPAADQYDSVSIVVAHLAEPDMPVPQPDTSIASRPAVDKEADAELPKDNPNQPDDDAATQN
ncbi:MAG: hypothetical protein KF752_13510 [Pirellulaceae bacterium]|nr:hypothetical protein [Pirellulaceae bacterium]